jgi:uncharacterized protein YaiI (UPF0178 family)
MRILVDADACPVVDIVLEEGLRRGAEVILFCDTAHRMERTGAVTVTVDRGADSVDFALVNRAQKGDIVVTQDYGLAAMALARGARPLHQNGRRYREENIDGLLAMRHEAREFRRAGGRTKGPKKRTREQDAAFRAALAALMEEEG